MKSFQLLFVSMFVMSIAQAQSLGMQHLGAIGGQITDTQGNSLIHGIGAVGSTVIKNDIRLDQGMFLACDLSCDSLKTSIDGLLYENPLISLYPNPTEGLIRLEGEARLIHRYILYTVEGREIANATIDDAQISLTGFPAGLYFLRVYGRSGELSLVGKIEKR